MPEKNDGLSIPASRHERVRAYYQSLDEHDYERLASLLHPDFVQHRPDMTLDGRVEFVTFMRERRPNQETSHPIDAIYTQIDGDGVVVEGRLLDANGRRITRFVDVFSFEEGLLWTLRTYVD